MHLATVVVPLSVHVAMLGVFMFLNGIATGGLDNGMYTLFYCEQLILLLHTTLFRTN